MSRALKEAQDAYRMWHKRDPDSYYGKNVRYPECMAEMGVAKEACYWSDKWKRECALCQKVCETDRCPDCGGHTEETVGRYELYRHVHDSSPSVFGGDGEDASTCDLLSVPNFDSNIPVEELGFCEEITWRDMSRRLQTETFGESLMEVSDDENDPIIKSKSEMTRNKKARLFGTRDKKALVIVPTSGDPLIIRGGRMRITQYGIVH